MLLLRFRFVWRFYLFVCRWNISYFIGSLEEVQKINTRDFPWQCWDEEVVAIKSKWKPRRVLSWNGRDDVDVDYDADDDASSATLKLNQTAKSEESCPPTVNFSWSHSVYISVLKKTFEISLERKVVHGGLLNYSIHYGAFSLCSITQRNLLRRRRVRLIEGNMRRPHSPNARCVMLGSNTVFVLKTSQNPFVAAT